MWLICFSLHVRDLIAIFDFKWGPCIQLVCCRFGDFATTDLEHLIWWNSDQEEIERDVLFLFRRWWTHQRNARSADLKRARAPLGDDRSTSRGKCTCTYDFFRFSSNYKKLWFTRLLLLWLRYPRFQVPREVAPVRGNARSLTCLLTSCLIDLYCCTNLLCSLVIVCLVNTIVDKSTEHWSSRMSGVSISGSEGHFEFIWQPCFGYFVSMPNELVLSISIFWGGRHRSFLLVK